MKIKISKSEREGKKFKAVIDDSKTVHFGAVGYEDYTIHKDPERKQRYITRHEKRESWGKEGIDTAGFWSRWLLWNLPSLRASAKDIEKRFSVEVVMK